MAESLMTVIKSSGFTGFDGILGYIRRYPPITLLIFTVSIGPVDLTTGTSSIFLIWKAFVPEPSVRKPCPRHLHYYPHRDGHCVCRKTD